VVCFMSLCRCYLDKVATLLFRDSNMQRYKGNVDCCLFQNTHIKRPAVTVCDILSALMLIPGFPHNFQNQIPWHSMTFSMTFPWPLLHFFHACLIDTYTCKLVTVLLKIADVALMGSNSTKLAPCVVAVSHLKTKPTLLSISTSYLHCQI